MAYEYYKEFLELLQPYKSEETKKSRRNLVVTCFTVIAVRFVGIDLTQAQPFGVHLDGGKETYVLWLAVMLIGYWRFMLHVHSKHDDEIQKERVFVLSLRKQRADVEHAASPNNLREARHGLEPAKNPHMEYLRIFGDYEDYKKRTQKAAWYRSILDDLDRVVIFVLPIFALAVLIDGMTR